MYVEDFQRFHTGLKLRWAACLFLQFLRFEYLHYDKRKSSVTARAPLTTKLILKQVRLNATMSVLLVLFEKM